MQYPGVEVGEPFGFTETQFPYGGGIFHNQRIIATDVGIRPYLYFFCLEGGADEGGGIIAATLLQIVGFAESIPANTSLGDE